MSVAELPPRFILRHGMISHHVDGRKRIRNQHFAGAYFAAHSIQNRNKRTGYTSIS